MDLNAVSLYLLSRLSAAAILASEWWQSNRVHRFPSLGDLTFWPIARVPAISRTAIKDFIFMVTPRNF
jgi:hypothetical protein